MSVLSVPLFGTTHSFEVARAGDGRASVRVAGDVDIAAVRGFNALVAAEERAGRTTVSVDLSAVSFMDCAFVGALVAAHHRLRAAGGQLLLLSFSAPVTRLLAAVQLEHTLVESPLPEVGGDLHAGVAGIRAGSLGAYPAT